ncbi:MAG: 5-(carboxyamino)imidazole ribonucleotide mutase [Planctomycetota bacterium]|nr:5-(carboxyamino)imidazole ribonucleotide mutase [Planctomycetota bacterium]
MSDSSPLVAVLMGSTSDWDTMQHCSAQLSALGVPHECKAISAHRQPATLHAYVEQAEKDGVRVFIGAAGGAAHLPGVLASLTARPVLGVPMKGWATEGMDALLAIAQMPGGVPVGTLAIGKAGAKNAAILATQILGLEHPTCDEAVRAMRAKQAEGASDLPVAEAP